MSRLFLAVVVLSPIFSYTGCDRSPTIAASAARSPSKTQDVKSEPSLPLEKTFDDIKFEMEKTDPFERSMLTKEVEALFGKKIRIRGYMFPTLKKRGLKQFVLVRDNLECCFGPGAALYDCILVHMLPGKTAEYSIRPIAVEGTFQFEEFRDFDGTTRAIYRIDGESAE